MKLDITYWKNKFKTDFFTFFLGGGIQDFSLNIGVTLSHFYRYIDDIYLEGTMSQNVDVCPIFFSYQ